MTESTITLARVGRALWIAALAGAGLVLLAWATGLITPFSPPSRDAVADLAARVGFWGPAVIMALLTAAVVASPIPSAPIALAAGAVYGHTAGTIYVAVGAEIGALVAFALARWLGRDVVERWLGEKLESGFLGSQTALMWTVFLSRLMPFVSFDLISYAAGLSRLRLWRFALATFAGIVPASFALAHFGSTAMDDGGQTAAIIALSLGLLTLGSVTVATLRQRHVMRNRMPPAASAESQGE